MPPILPLEASEILVVDSISGSKTIAWESVSLALYFPCPCSSCPGWLEKELFVKANASACPLSLQNKLTFRSSVPIRLIKLVLLWVSSVCFANTLEGKV